MNVLWVGNMLRRGGGAVRFHHRAAALQEQARLVPRTEQCQVFRELAELCLQAGQRSRAMVYYGQAIDVELELGEYDAAIELCRYVIERLPEVVRTRCTLAFLLLGRGDSWAFRREVAEYVKAAERKNDRELAITRLRMMMSVTDDPAMRVTIQKYLARLGDHEKPFQVGGSRASDHRVLPQQLEQRERWALMLRQAITGSGFSQSDPGS